jgi:predicted phage gp36 major capsid-like protein
VSGALERYQLPAEVRERLEELRELSKKAEGGEKGARAQLRRAVARCSPRVIAEASDIAQRAQAMLIGTIAAGEPLMEEALAARLALMREEIAGGSASSLEILLTERVVAGWLLVEVLEGLTAAQFYKGAPKSSRLSPSYIIQQSRILESATRR